KLRLIACGCLRRLWHLLDDERCRHAIQVAERLADGWATREEVGAAASAAEAAFLSTAKWPTLSDVIMAYFAVSFVLDDDAHAAAEIAVIFTEEVHFGEQLAQDVRRGQCELIRDVFLPPSRTVGSSHAWRDPGMLALAETLYDHHAFDRMPE